MGVKASEEVWKYLQAQKLIDHKGKVQDELRTALKDGTFDMPAAFKAQLPEIREALRKLAGKLDIKNADNRFELKPNKAVLLHVRRWMAFEMFSFFFAHTSTLSRYGEAESILYSASHFSPRIVANWNMADRLPA